MDREPAREADEELPPATRSALRAYAERAAPELMAAACADAHAEVRRRLRDALVPMLLEEAAGPETAGSEAAGSEAAGAEGGETGWYVFGVVRPGGSAPGLPAEVELVAHGSVAAVVEPVALADFPSDGTDIDGPDDLAWLERYARRHDHVLNAVLDSAAVLPLRFGTVVGTHDDVRTLLRRHEPVFGAWLDELADRAEYTVKAWVDEAALAEHVAAGEPAGATTGTAYLQQRQAQRQRDEQLRQSRARLVDEVHERLAAVAEAATTVAGRSDAPAPQPAHHGAYLLAAAQREALAAEIEALASEHHDRGLQLDLAGPWPAHHFLPDSWEGDAADATPARPTP